VAFCLFGEYNYLPVAAQFPAFKTLMKKKKKSNSIIFILGLIMVINALSYGTIIPLLYPYASQFGIDGFGLGLLFSSFSLFQFLATPIIGRLSDQYGRKPLLLISLLGTAVSQLLFAMAGNIPQLFFARILDGITGGNNSVAQAVIADSFAEKDRTKAFGLLGASFGLGFLIGPAIGGFLSSISMQAPFYFSAALALIGVVLGWLILPETLSKTSKNKAAKNKQAFIDLPLLWRSLTASAAGPILLVALLGMTSHQALVIGFQSFTVDVLAMSATEIGVMFACIGLVSVIMQAVGVRYLISLIKSNSLILKGSLFLSAFVSGLLFFSNSLVYFVVVTMIYVATFAPQQIILTGLLSAQTKAEDQGGMMGIMFSYLSLGQIIGPVIAGAVTNWSISAVFVVAALFFVISLGAAQRIKDTTKIKADI
jgi:multidrug resistance protein